MAASIVPVIQMVVGNDPYRQYTVLSVIVLSVAALMTCGALLADGHSEHLEAPRQQHLRSVGSSKVVDRFAPHYKVELMVAACAFCIIGAQVNVVAYVNPYLGKLPAVPIAIADQPKVLMVFWIFVGIGRIVGVLDQRFFLPVTEDDRFHGATNVAGHLAICLAVSAIAILLLALFMDSSWAIWLGVCLFGLFFGPSLSLAYDMNNRLTLPTEKSTAIVMVSDLDCYIIIMKS